MFITSTVRMDKAGEMKRLGPVTGEFVIEEKIYKGILAEMHEHGEIRSDAYEKEIEKAKDTVMDQMTKKAEALGANAIIAMNMYHEIIQHGRMMLIAGKGVAALIEGLEE